MIKCFEKEYRWLSNMYPCKIVLRGIEYRTVEHAYQSEKNDSKDWKRFCSLSKNPRFVKIKSKEVKLVENWDEKRLIVMKFCIDQKFSKEPFRRLLLNTGDQEIQEGNDWGDTFWGVDKKSGVGQNNLGKIIMEKRKNLRENI